MRVNYFGKLVFIVLSLAGSSQSISAQGNASRYPLIPYPAHLKETTGLFAITSSTSIQTQDASFQNEAVLLSQLFNNSFGKPLAIKTGPSKSSIILKKDACITASEGYNILITKQSAILSASSPAGMFRAVQTIRQLLPVSIEITGKSLQPGLKLPCVEIKDAPAFSWRGLHLDVSRHFFSIDYIKKLIGIMALYKFNKLHLHLTDDQGWRMEIKKISKADGRRCLANI